MHSNLKRIGFVLGHNCNAHEEIFSQLSSILIEEFRSCQTEPHLRLTCPRASQNTKQYNSWTTNHEKLWMICDLLALRPISHITQKTLSFLLSTKIKQITKTMVIFKTGTIFLYCIRCDPIPPQTSVQQLAHTLPLALLFVNRVSVSPEWEGNSLVGCNVNAKRQIISGVLIGEWISE